MVWDGFGITLFRWQLGLGFDFSNGVAVIVYFSHLIVYMFCFCVRFIFAIGFFGWSPCILQYKSRGQRIDFTKETVRLGYPCHHANYLFTGWLLYILVNWINMEHVISSGEDYWEKQECSNYTIYTGCYQQQTFQSPGNLANFSIPLIYPRIYSGSSVAMWCWSMLLRLAEPPL